VKPNDGEGQVITFYSYKGGTGRSMLLANVAWLLACSGERVLAVDWDLEGPGLHRYFSPFLLDKEMIDTDGVIDFVIDFTVATRTLADNSRSIDRDWIAPYADITRYATPLQWDFPFDGRLDFVGAGRQGTSYSTRVTGFEWQRFYEQLGGGAFIDEARRIVRQRYDYVVIDSRTGVSDTSGICTVQLPDVLVVCFTLNNQSIDGAAAAAKSVSSQRKDDLRIFPVPTRIENAEKDKRDLRREMAMRAFGTLLEGTSESERMAYWDDVGVLYEPFYAYEELLATFRDEPGSAHTILNSAERLAHRISGERLRAVRMNPNERAVVLAAYEGTSPSPLAEAATGGGRLYISYRREDAMYARRLFDQLSATLGSQRVSMDVGMLPGDDYMESVESVVRNADVVLAVIGPSWPQNDPHEHVNHELAFALEQDRRVIPVLVGGARMPAARELPNSLTSLTRRNAADLSDSRWSYDVDRLLAAVEVAMARRRDLGVTTSGADELFAPSAASEVVIERVLRTSTVNRVTSAVAIVTFGAVAFALVAWLIGHL
jgi:cellulose biosynthesis protein BcsQ